MDFSNKRIKPLVNAKKHPSLKYLPFNLGEFKHFAQNSSNKISEIRTLMPSAFLACPNCVPASSSSYLATDIIDLQGLVDVCHRHLSPFTPLPKISCFLKNIFNCLTIETTLSFIRPSALIAYSFAINIIIHGLNRASFFCKRNKFLSEYQTICVPIGQLDMLEYSTMVCHIALANYFQYSILQNYSKTFLNNL